MARDEFGYSVWVHTIYRGRGTWEVGPFGVDRPKGEARVGIGRGMGQAGKLDRCAAHDSAASLAAGRQTLALSGRNCAREISDLVGGLVAEHLGRGPKAHTYLSDDVVTVVLEDTLTQGERRLVRAGMGEQVLSARLAFQQTMREDLIAGIEQITGRRVRACANEMTPDIAVEAMALDGSHGGNMVGGAHGTSAP